jgi:prevent-host-death family protein
MSQSKGADPVDTVTLAHAKEHLEELIERAARGEDVRITDQRGLAVCLVPADRDQRPPGKVIFGQWQGLVEIPHDKLFEPLSPEEMDWLSGENSP